jgi:hypothetical protein
MPVIPAIQGNTTRRNVVRAGPGIKQDMVSEKANTKRAGKVAQVIKHLPSRS